MRRDSLGRQSASGFLFAALGFSLLTAMVGCEGREEELVATRTTVAPTETPAPPPLPAVPSKTPTPDRMLTPIVVVVRTATMVPTATVAPTATAVPTATPTATATSAATAVPTATAAVTMTPTATAMPTATAVPTASATLAPTATPTSTATSTPEDLAVERLSVFAPWVIEPPDGTHEEVRSILVDIWLFDAGFAEMLAGSDWLADGVVKAEASLLEIVHAFVDADRPSEEGVTLARRILDLRWVKDGVQVGSTEGQALKALARISGADGDRARAVTTFDWLWDDVDKVEVSALEGIADSFDVLSGLEGHLSERFQAFASNFDAGSATIADTFFELADLITKDSDTGRRVLDTVFFDDAEFSEQELSGLREVVRYMGEDPDFGVMAANLTWVLDGVDAREQDALFHVFSFFEIDAELAAKAAEIRWIVAPSEGDPGGQLKSTSQLLDIAGTDPEFAGEMMDWEWIKDDLVGAEPNLLGILSEMMWTEPDIAKQLPLVVADRFEHLDGDTFDIVDTASLMALNAPDIALFLVGEAKNWTPKIARFAFESVHLMIVHRQDGLDSLMRQAWYRDGVDVEEAVFIGALGSDLRGAGSRSDDPHNTFFEDMTRSHHVQKQQVMFPLAGEVMVWVVKHWPFGFFENFAAEFAEFAIETESFFGQPFPAEDLIVVIGEGNSPGNSVNRGDHVLFRMDWPGGAVPSSDARSLFREYYLTDRFGELWLSDGLSWFFNRFPDERSFSGRLAWPKQERIEYVDTFCFHGRGIEDMQDAIDHRQVGGSIAPCTEYLGALIVFNLFESMGWDAMGRALGDIYSKSTEIVDERHTRFSVAEDSLYESFLNNAPQIVKADVREVYTRLHGGRFLFEPDPIVEFDSLPEEVRGSLLRTTKWRDRPDFDVLDEKYLSPLGALAEIWKIDEDLAYEAAQSPWVQERVGYVVKDALTKLVKIAIADVDLASRLVQSLSIEQVGAVDARFAVDAVLRSVETDPSFAWEVVRSRWIDGDWSDEQWVILQSLADFAAADLEFAREVMRTWWVVDGLTELEPYLIRNIRRVVRTDPRLLEHIVKFDWLPFGARSESEPDTSTPALQQTAFLAAVDKDLALELVQIPWMRDGIDQHESIGIQRLRHIAVEDPARASKVVRSSWFSERITIVERQRLNEIYAEVRGVDQHSDPNLATMTGSASPDETPTTSGDVPTAPTGVSAEARFEDNGHKVVITWDPHAPDEGVTDWIITRWDPDSSVNLGHTRIGGLDHTHVRHEELDVAPSTTYAYTVHAANEHGQGAYSDRVTVTTGSEQRGAVPAATPTAVAQ